MTQHIYVSPTAPQFGLTLAFDDHDGKACREFVRFDKGQLILDDDDPHQKRLVEELEKLMRGRPDISANIRKVDMEAAEALSRQFQELHAQQYSGILGGTTSEEIRKIQQAEQMKRDRVTKNLDMPVDENPDLQLTEPTESAEPAEPAKVLGVLGKK